LDKVRLLTFAATWRGSYALHAVETILEGDDQQRQAILDHDPLPNLRPLMASPQESIRMRACHSVFLIVSRNAEQVQEVIDSSAVPPLLLCLADAAPEVHVPAVLAVACITIYGGTPQILLLVQQGCLPPLCDLLAAANAGTVLCALRGLEDILQAGSDDGAVGAAAGTAANPMAALVSEAGGASKLEELRASADDERVRSRAERLLQTYFGSAGAIVAEPGAAAAAAPSDFERDGADRRGGGEADDDDADADGMVPPRQRPRLA
jgi:importin subunit alpha-6/7